MKIKHISDLLYYDIPLLIHCTDDLAGNFVFVVLDYEVVNYIGKKLDDAIFQDFLVGKICLLTAFQKSQHKYLVAVFDGSPIGDADEYSPTESDLPEAGLFVKQSTVRCKSCERKIYIGELCACQIRNKNEKPQFIPQYEKSIEK